MKTSLGAFVLCLVLGAVLYPVVIGALARAHAGQRVQAYAPSTHRVKASTPTMGGILFCALAVLAWLFFDRSRSGFVLAFALIAGAGLGVLDDLANIRGRGVLGLLGRQKLVLQGLVGILVGVGLLRVGATHQVLPVLGNVDLHGGIVVLAAVAVMAASNAVNLTDGVDGLAGWCSVLVFSALWALALHIGAHSAAVLSAAVVGGVAAFLLYNWHPARVFMGDTGSLALGCTLAAVAAEVHMLWLLPLLGLVFVAETLSVIVNVTAIRRFHRRVFRASPLHHHFEELGLREQGLVLWFGAVAALAALLAVLAGIRSGMSA
ncbi:MAG TPA: phospho-N-acetylmuramoyl-pentapeptide-transferase [Candidatus Dormibacteraeota bacterium]|nr:phospho-N-acetylmuramoyl-pentapeptide-transferase [Candidatus Dormibacteraeota bacterium]